MQDTQVEEVKFARAAAMQEVLPKEAPFAAAKVPYCPAPEYYVVAQPAAAVHPGQEL